MEKLMISFDTSNDNRHATALHDVAAKHVSEAITIGDQHRTSSIHEDDPSGDVSIAIGKNQATQSVASYDQYGLKNFGISQLRTTPSINFIQVRTKFYLGKNTLKSVVAQLKRGCFDVLDTKFNSNYSFIVRDSLEGKSTLD